VQLPAFGELRGTSGKLLVVEGEADVARLRLSTTSRWWWRTAARRSDGPVTGKEGKEVNEVRHNPRQLIEERKGARGSPLAAGFGWRGGEVLSMHAGEKLKCGRLAATPATRLGGGAPGS
jgi:hypothetical protein